MQGATWRRLGAYLTIVGRTSGLPGGAIGVATSRGYRLPDELGDVDDQIGARLGRVIRGANLTDAHAHRVVEAAVARAVTEVEDGHRRSVVARAGRHGRSRATRT